MVLGQRGTHVAGNSATLTLLGRWRLRVGDQEIILGRRERRLLACLAINGGRSRDWLAATLWPDATEERATASLRTTLWSLRRTVPGLTCITGRLLSLGVGVESDLDRLRHDISKITSRTSAEQTDLDEAGVLQVSVAPELLPGWYEDWVLFERERLRNRQLEALKSLADRALRAGQTRPAITYANAAIAIEPHDDQSVIMLISAQLELGHVADALRSFHQYRTRLRAELNAQPSLQVRRVIEQALPAPLRSRSATPVAAPVARVVRLRAGRVAGPGK
ncbi:hypothetical protein FOE78_12225 [Microlunatus elymi]|uniref:DNA-binding transcriptional activator of the SARP family n=1 Tax=Microlunatus elymi TaxID=2596828 RepID=A0A516Q025_9ACTN|nr:BTAD domain-containing putative transcriptional regulator [Microlunatus elymi]QDP96571.1 hypothetical protein FOE78_12225 [Microlunatus elymi]